MRYLKVACATMAGAWLAGTMLYAGYAGAADGARGRSAGGLRGAREGRGGALASLARGAASSDAARGCSPWCRQPA